MDEQQVNEVSAQPNPLDFGAILSKAFELYKENLGILILVHLVAGILSAITGGIIAGPLYVGLSLIMLSLYDKKDPKPAVKDLFKGFEYFLPAFLVFLVIAVIMILVSAVTGPFASIAGVLVGTLTMFSFYLIAEKNLDFWPAIVGSYEIIKTNLWVYLGLYVVGSLLSSLGIIACCIGIIATVPYLGCVTVIAYRESGNSATEAPVTEEPTEEPVAEITEDSEQA